MPYYLMYGRRSLIGIDVEYRVTLPEISGKSQQNFTQKLEAQLKWALKTAKEHAEKEMAQHKHYHDCKMHCMRLEVGDQVLVMGLCPNHIVCAQMVQVPHTSKPKPLKLCFDIIVTVTHLFLELWSSLNYFYFCCESLAQTHI